MTRFGAAPGVALSWSVEPGAEQDTVFLADSLRISQVLFNLVHNALKVWGSLHALTVITVFPLFH